MKLRTLSLFIRSLIEPLAETGAAPDNAENLRRASDLLSSFGEMSVRQFGDLLEQAREYQSSKQHAFPAYLQPIITTSESIRSLKKRASEPDVNREDLVRDLHTVELDSLDQIDLARIAAAHGWEVKSKAKTAKKPEVIAAIWLGVTGQEMPKPSKAKSTAPKSGTPKNTKKIKISVDDYAQKINGMKERANSFDVTREELEQELNSLNLEQVDKTDLVALAKNLACDVNSRTSVPNVIDAIRRVVLDVKEMLVGSAG